MSVKTLGVIILPIILIVLTLYLYSNFQQNKIGNNDLYEIQLPVEGVWKVVRSPGHETYAYDLSRVDPHTFKKLTKSRFQHLFGNTIATDWYSWDEKVYSPIDGVIVQSFNNIEDRMNQVLLKDLGDILLNRFNFNSDNLSNFGGNYVIIRGDDFYVFLAHMQQYSLEVDEGDTVNKGDIIGIVGNSGVTLEPHLHFQLFDQIDDFKKALAPNFLITKFERWSDDDWEFVQNAELKKGDIVRTTLTN